MSEAATGPATELCLPTDDAVLIDRIRGFVANALDCPVENVGEDDDLYESLDLDSLGAAMVFIDLSYEFGVPDPAPDVDVAALNTVRRLAAYVRTFETATAGVQPCAGP